MASLWKAEIPEFGNFTMNLDAIKIMSANVIEKFSFHLCRYTQKSVPKTSIFITMIQII